MYTPPKRRRLSKAERKAMFDLLGGKCAYCGCEIGDIRAMQVDHLIPMEFYEAYLVQGRDLDTLENMLPACRSCNNYKSSLTLEKFRTAISNFIFVLTRDSTTFRNAVRFGMVTPTPHKVVFYFEEVAQNAKEE